MSNVGFRIRKDFERAPSEVLKGYEGIATPNIGDVMGRLSAMDYRIKPVNKQGIHIVGSALTVRTHPSDNLMVHKAMDLAKPGDIIVIDACGDMGNAILGELMCHYAKVKGIKGYIVDGPVRDLTGIAQMGFPVFSKGGSPRGPYKEGPGEINTTISCGNVPVSPGDVIVGDDDGIIVIPKQDASAVLEKAKALASKEKEIIQSIYDGKWDRTWVDEVLLQKGCEIID
ncbi:RraA family protein [Cytobacillus firmus]|uniref:RraA family protein n=1 Tax=Bacillaceae TaxID=186817 RepID=UPI0013D1006D|nr:MULTISPECIES: RraA family protein [Bacillaceae]MBG9448512.1 dimethylmenaquinone methyltransferase [Cytobacillus firmus]NUH82811.1 RraA family protein [Cytobacillus firmus]USK38071.1 RraA family protein [Cytobacillus firmus]WHY33240.1 RraA family protein [Cytobacillus firmus]